MACAVRMRDVNGQRHNRSALILYGSESGISQDAAEQLGRILERLRFLTEVLEMDLIQPVCPPTNKTSYGQYAYSYGLSELSMYTIVIFTISTTGQGDVPRNARKFWRSLLRKSLPTDYLSPVNFTTFGFGDSSYVKFNWASRKLHKRLRQLGASEIYPRGEADEQHPEGVDGAFLPWSLNLRSHILQKYPLPNGLLPIPDDELLPPKWILELADASKESKKTTQTLNSDPSPTTASPSAMDRPIQNDECLKCPSPNGFLEQKDIILPPADRLPIPDTTPATVISNNRLTADDHWQDVRYIKLWINDLVRYQPGDIITIYPKNFPEDVEGLIQLMGWTDVADKPLVFRTTATSNLKDISIPPIANLYPMRNPTLRSLLLHNLDITAIPRRFFFEIISKFTENPMHRERLLDFTNPAFTDEFFDYTSRPRRSMLEVLHDFPSVRIPWKFVPYIFPVLRGRQFSIASGGYNKHSMDNCTEVEICVAIVKYQTVLKKVRQGVCSRYLSSLACGTIINVSFHIGNFRYDSDDAQKPVLMIAPGTGIAPMRSLSWERAMFADLWDRHSDPQKGLITGKAVLIFGGRNFEKDYLFRDEWESLGLDVQVLTAFSRDQKEKRYVQDVIRENAMLVYDMLVKQGAKVYICGSSGKMPMAVRQALLDAFVECGRAEDWKFTEKVAEEILVGIEKEGRYVQDTW